MLELAIATLCTVTRVVDGDTLITNCNNTEIRIRLCGIDSPELKQEGGRESKQFVEQLIKDHGNQVSVVPISVDFYGRTVAEIFLEPFGIPFLLQSESLRNGQSYLYKQYLNSCPSKDLMVRESAIAQSERRGLFANQNTIKPWEFRRNRRLEPTLIK
jgi:endonuclease YncB( thermonuclease family)